MNLFLLLAALGLEYPSVASPQIDQFLPAYICIDCPTGVELIIQGQHMLSVGPHRRFQSPPLLIGQTFTYEIHILRHNDEVAVRMVDVEAGRTSYVTITLDDAPTPSPSVPPGPAGDRIPNFGIDLKQLHQPVSFQTAELNGTPIPADSVKDLLLGDDRLPDPRRSRLTIIGSEQHRQSAQQLLQSDLKDLAADYVIQDYAPDHWAVARTGFVTTGQPTIYAQAPDGRVLFRQDDLTNLRLNLESVRKPSPNYHPDHDPDHRRILPDNLSLPELLPLVCLAAAVWFLWKSFQLKLNPHA